MLQQKLEPVKDIRCSGKTIPTYHRQNRKQGDRTRLCGFEVGRSPA
jgi:hypothetical protein